MMAGLLPCIFVAMFIVVPSGCSHLCNCNYFPDYVAKACFVSCLDFFI